jgi:hypothetical protein
MTKNEPELGTTAYLFSLMNPVRRPLLAPYLTIFWKKVAVVAYVLLFALFAFGMGGRGLQGVGTALWLSAAFYVLLAIKAELWMRLFAIQKNMFARIDRHRRGE